MNEAIAVGDRVRVRQLEPGTWASSLSGQEGTVEEVDQRDMLVRIDGRPEGGELSWLTVDEVDRRPTVAELEEQLATLRRERNELSHQHDIVVGLSMRRTAALDRARDEVAALSAKVERLTTIEVRAAKHAVASATVIAALMRRLGIVEVAIEGDELAAIDEVIDLDVERGERGDYERLRVSVAPRVHDDG